MPIQFQGNTVTIPHILFLAQTALKNALILSVIITKNIQGWFHQSQESNFVRNFIEEDFWRNVQNIKQNHPQGLKELLWIELFPEIMVWSRKQLKNFEGIFWAQWGHTTRTLSRSWLRTINFSFLRLIITLLMGPRLINCCNSATIQALAQIVFPLLSTEWQVNNCVICGVNLFKELGNQ